MTGARVELDIIKEEIISCKGSPIKLALVTWKMSVQSMVSLESFEITLPVVLSFKCSSRPVHIRGQRSAVEEDAESEVKRRGAGDSDKCF